MKKDEFDAKAFIADIEKHAQSEVGDKASAAVMARAVIERVEKLEREVPSMKEQMRTALEERAFDARLDFDRGSNHKDALSAELSKELGTPKYYKERFTEADKEVEKAIHIAEKNNGGKDVDLSQAHSGKTYTGKVIGQTDNYVIQELSGDPSKAVAHDKRQLANGKQHLENGRDIEVRYPHGSVGLVKDAAKHEVGKDGREASKVHNMDHERAR